MNGPSLLFWMISIWSCVACAWPPSTAVGGVKGGFLEQAFFHDRNIGGGIGAGIGGGFGATVGAFFGGEEGASLGGAFGGGVGGAVGGFLMGGPLGAVSGCLGGLIGGFTGAVHSYKIACSREGTSLFGKVAGARVGGFFGGALGGYYGIGGGGQPAKEYLMGGYKMFTVIDRKI